MCIRDSARASDGAALSAAAGALLRGGAAAAARALGDRVALSNGRPAGGWPILGRRPILKQEAHTKQVGASRWHGWPRWLDGLMA
eukprot:1131888-Prymnesium_polylepis.2